MAPFIFVCKQMPRDCLRIPLPFLFQKLSIERGEYKRQARANGDDTEGSV